MLQKTNNSHSALSSIGGHTIFWWVVPTQTSRTADINRTEGDREGKSTNTGAWRKGGDRDHSRMVSEATKDSGIRVAVPIVRTRTNNSPETGNG